MPMGSLVEASGVVAAGGGGPEGTAGRWDGMRGGRAGRGGRAWVEGAVAALRAGCKLLPRPPPPCGEIWSRRSQISSRCVQSNDPRVGHCLRGGGGGSPPPSPTPRRPVEGLVGRQALQPVGQRGRGHELGGAGAAVRAGGCKLRGGRSRHGAGEQHCRSCHSGSTSRTVRASGSGDDRRAALAVVLPLGGRRRAGSRA